MIITHINPDSMLHNPAFSQGIVVSGGKTIFVGGQNGTLQDGSLAGDTFAEQTEQAYRNVLKVLEAAGASQENVARLAVFMVKGQDIHEGFAAAQKVWGNFPTAITVLIVEGLAMSGALVEIEATAFID